MNQRLDQQRLERVLGCFCAPSAQVPEHVTDLDRSWGVERTLEANAAVISLASVALAATPSRKWLVLDAAVPAFLLQHALQGWCPPITVFRRLGSRTRREIDTERTAIKALRGDFLAVAPDPGEATSSAQQALNVATRR